MSLRGVRAKGAAGGEETRSGGAAASQPNQTTGRFWSVCSGAAATQAAADYTIKWTDASDDKEKLAGLRSNGGRAEESVGEGMTWYSPRSCGE